MAGMLSTFAEFERDIICERVKAGSRRLRRVASVCRDYGQRVQNSVFECRVGKTQWTILREKLLQEINPNSDSLIFYFLDAHVGVEHYGCKKPVDLEQPIFK